MSNSYRYCRVLPLFGIYSMLSNTAFVSKEWVKQILIFILHCKISCVLILKQERNVCCKSLKMANTGSSDSVGGHMLWHE